MHALSDSMPFFCCASIVPRLGTIWAHLLATYLNNNHKNISRRHIELYNKYKGFHICVQNDCRRRLARWRPVARTLLRMGMRHVLILIRCPPHQEAELGLLGMSLEVLRFLLAILHTSFFWPFSPDVAPREHWIGNASGFSLSTFRAEWLCVHERRKDVSSITEGSMSSHGAPIV
eukprot:1134220-Pelagomonas_calceolata.AAC.5